MKTLLSWNVLVYLWFDEGFLTLQCLYVYSLFLFYFYILKPLIFTLWPCQTGLDHCLRKWFAVNIQKFVYFTEDKKKHSFVSTSDETLQGNITCTDIFAPPEPETRALNMCCQQRVQKMLKLTQKETVLPLMVLSNQAIRYKERCHRQVKHK